MITKSDFFNKDTLLIFTDASIKKTQIETIGCAGAIAINGTTASDIFDIRTRIIRHTTSNNSEINAIELGLEIALKYCKNFKKIILFSDSKLCIFGLREWIVNWVRDSPGRILLSSTGEPVCNQSDILQCIYMIEQNNLRISLLHTSAHVTSSASSIYKSLSSFKTINKIADFVEEDVIVEFAQANNYIDEYTGQLLVGLSPIAKKPESLITNFYVPFDIKKYKDLISTQY